MPFTLNNIHHSDAIGITDFCLSDMFWPSEYGTCSLYSDPDCIQIPTARGFIFPPVYDGITQSFEWNQIFIFRLPKVLRSHHWAYPIKPLILLEMTQQKNPKKRIWMRWIACMKEFTLKYIQMVKYSNLFIDVFYNKRLITFAIYILCYSKLVLLTSRMFRSAIAHRY